MLRSYVLAALFWIFATLAVAAGLASVKRGRKFLACAETRLSRSEWESVETWPATVLIVPVKGSEPGLAANLRALAAQDHPNFQLMVVCADASDPAARVARSALGADCRLIVAGAPPAGTGEKIHNLSAAVKKAGRQAEVLAFADSDGRVRPDWLRKLTAPLTDTELGATTGFRWHFPAEGGFWPLIRSVWDSSIVTVMDTEDKSFAWGGAMALRRETFEVSDVLAYWRGAISDDYRLAQAVLAAGKGVRFVPEAMVETPGRCTGRAFLAWAVRQLTITRVYSFHRWAAGCASHIVYCAAHALCVAQAVSGHPFSGLGALLLIVLPGMAVGSVRCYVCSLVFPQREAWLERFGWVYFWMAPLSTWIWLYAFLRSGATRTIRWRGRTYELVSESSTREVGD